MENLKGLCNTCKNTVGDKEIVQGNCKLKCHKELHCAYKAFTSNKRDILEENATTTFNTYKRSFLNYITTFRNCEIESKQMINNTLINMQSYYDIYSTMFYKRVDLYVSKWDSWFCRFNMFLKNMMVNGYLCTSIKDIIIASVKDYSKFEHYGTRIDDLFISHVIRLVGISNINNPVENGDYCEVLLKVHVMLMKLYEILFIQYVQEDRMGEDGEAKLYYCPANNELGNEFISELLEFRISELLDKNDEFKIIITGDLDKSLSEHPVIIKYKNKITNFSDI